MRDFLLETDVILLNVILQTRRDSLNTISKSASYPWQETMTISIDLMIFFFFFGHAYNMQKFIGQGLNPRRSTNQSHSSDNIRSLTH